MYVIDILVCGTYFCVFFLCGCECKCLYCFVWVLCVCVSCECFVCVFHVDTMFFEKKIQYSSNMNFKQK